VKQPKRYVYISGKIFEFVQNWDGRTVELGMAYADDDVVYAYKGESPEEGEPAEPGIYICADGGLGVVPYREDRAVTVEDVYDEKEENEFTVRARGLERLLREAAVPFSRPSSKLAPQREGVVRQEKDYLRYVIKEDDDDMVRLLKETINSCQITSQDVYDVMGSQSKGYNLTYGLDQRPTITWQSFVKWADILGMRVKLSLIDAEVEEECLV
jgi:hypothetical protein